METNSLRVFQLRDTPYRMSDMPKFWCFPGKKTGDSPGFRSLRICTDLQGSAKIVALNLEDPYRSARSLQKCADFL